MNAGVIEQCGTPEDVYENPTSVFAAGFIGTSNLMAGTYTHGSVSITADLQLPVPGHSGSQTAPGQGGHLSREDLDERLHTDDGADPRHDRRHQLPRGDHAVPRLGGHRRDFTVLEQNLPRMRADNRWNAGDRVQIGWLPEHAVVLR